MCALERAEVVFGWRPDHPEYLARDQGYETCDIIWCWSEMKSRW